MSQSHPYYRRATRGAHYRVRPQTLAELARNHARRDHREGRSGRVRGSLAYDAAYAEEREHLDAADPAGHELSQDC